jgi:hypothetical protein
MALGATTVQLTIDLLTYPNRHHIVKSTVWKEQRPRPFVVVKTTTAFVPLPTERQATLVVLEGSLYLMPH